MVTRAALVVLLVVASGCANVLGLEDGKPAPDDAGTPDATTSAGGTGGAAGATSGVDPACAACAAESCPTETDACKSDPSCGSCIDDATDDPFVPPCADVPGVHALVVCACAACPACESSCR